MNILKKIYNSDFYTFIIVILALFSLFAPLTDRQDLYIDVIFIVDLLLSTLIFIKYFDNKSYKEYVKHHIFDMISCIPIQFLSIFKTFR